MRKGHPECWGTFKEYSDPTYERKCIWCGHRLGCAHKTRKLIRIQEKVNE